jgi:TatD DNase family protein
VIDSHAHLTAKAFRKDLDAVLGRAAASGVTSIITVGFDLATSEASARLAAEYPQVYATVGIHPHDATTLDLKALDRLEKLAAQPKVVAVGEIGLDYYRDLSPRHVQEDAFRLQIGLAKNLDLPIIVHDREAHERTMQVLKEEKVSRGVLHCFSGDSNLARRGVEMGLYVSFAGPVTYDGRKAAAVLGKVPEDRVLVETDCPYLAPVPHRGKRNEPAYVRYVLERVAGLLGRPADEVDGLTEANTRRLFSL